jgi:hypothetical protein
LRPLRRVTADTAAVIRRAADWIAGHALDRANKLDLASSNLALFGLALAARQSPRALKAAERLVRTIAENPKALEAEFKAGRFLTPLLAMRALPVTSWARKTLAKTCQAAAATAFPDSKLAELSPVTWAARRLISNDSPPAPPPPLPWKAQLADPIFPYLAPTELIRPITLDIAACSCFGDRKPLFSAATQKNLSRVLTFWLFCYLRDQDLDMLCPLARALRFIGLDRQPEYKATMAFILSRQRTPGYFSMHELSVAMQSRMQVNFDAPHDAFLPLTVASMWTLSPLA